MSEDDVLFGYRLQLFDHAARTIGERGLPGLRDPPLDLLPLEAAGRRHGLEILRPRSGAGRGCPTSCSPFVEERIVAFALGHPGPGRGGSPPSWRAALGRDRRLPNGVWRCLRRHGLNTRGKRLSLVAGYAAPYEPPREPEPVRHVEAEQPGELVGIDCFFVGRLCGTKGAVWQLTAIDLALLLRLGRARQLPAGQPDRRRRPRSSPGASPPICGGRLAARARAHRQRRRVPLRRFHATLERSARATPSSAPAARRRTATSRRCTGPSSRSAGDPPSPAT